MTATAQRLDHLRREHPEWAPWLHVVDIAVRESESPVWDGMVPASAAAAGATPRLDGATLRLHRAVVHDYLERLLLTAAGSGTHEMSSLIAAMNGCLDVLALFEAALCQRDDDVQRAATGCGAHPDALQAVAALVPVPLLQACNRTWETGRDWVEPYCPVCGSWPAFAEIRGIERSRYFRCGRCGCGWPAHGLSCPFCGTIDHRELVRLVPAEPGAAAAVDACTKCRGYVKAFNRLQACEPGAVLLEDLGGVTLDLAALEQGYSRPPTAGYALAIAVTELMPRRSAQGRTLD